MSATPEEEIPCHSIPFSKNAEAASLIYAESKGFNVDVNSVSAHLLTVIFPAVKQSKSNSEEQTHKHSLSVFRRGLLVAEQQTSET